MNVGNNGGTSRLPFLGFGGLKNWSMYNHSSIFWLIFQKCLLEEVVKAEKMVSKTFFLSIYGKFLLCFSYSIKIKTQQPSRKRSHLLNDGLW